MKNSILTIVLFFGLFSSAQLYAGCNCKDKLSKIPVLHTQKKQLTQTKEIA